MPSPSYLLRSADSVDTARPSAFTAVKIFIAILRGEKSPLSRAGTTPAARTRRDSTSEASASPRWPDAGRRSAMGTCCWVALISQALIAASAFLTPSTRWCTFPLPPSVPTRCQGKNAFGSPSSAGSSSG